MVTTILIFMVLISGKVIHNLIRIERIHKKTKIVMEENKNILIKNI